MFVLGTAGHVDHGKSTLVIALSGIDPDRLPEEKERGMTIDLGFAWFSLPEVGEIGLVDVPGHERFVKNMIAGAGGIDAVLFIVAADDGWMPQSQEHLEILRFLGVSTGIIVLTKTDLIAPDWAELVEQDIRTKLSGTFLAGAPIIRTVAAKGLGISELKAEIGKLLKSISARQDKGKPRLFIDRVFTLTGKGTVVTGTLTGGGFQRGEKVEILPLKKEARIRSLQTHKKEIETGQPGSRLALNLADVEKENLSRGKVLVRPNSGALTSRIATRVKILPNSRFGLKDGQKYLFILGTQEVLGYASLFEKKEIVPGMEDWAVFRFSEPVCAHYLDRFIVRLPSPALTLGGGKVYDPFLSALAKKESGIQLAVLLTETPESWIKYRLAQTFSLTFSELEKCHSFSTAEMQKVLADVRSDGEIEKLGERWAAFERLAEKVSLMKNEIATYHRRFPQRPGLRVAEAGQLLKVSEDEGFLVCDYLVSNGGYVRRGPFVSETRFESSLNEQQKEIAQELLKRLTFTHQKESANLAAMHSEKENEILHFLLHSGQLIEVSSDFFLPKADFENLVAQIRGLIQTDGKTTAGRVRDSLGASRKLVIPLLEKLDALGITRRVGDKRVLAE